MTTRLTLAALALALGTSVRADDAKKPNQPKPEAVALYGNPDLDAKFLKAAYSGNLLEIKLSERALEQLKEHEKVRDLARMLADHHEKARLRVKQVAEKSGVKLSEELLPAHKAELELAMERKGELYHVPYLFHLASSHTLAILEVSHRLRFTKDEAVKGYCVFILPVLKEHFATIKPMAEREARVDGMTK